MSSPRVPPTGLDVERPRGGMVPRPTDGSAGPARRPAASVVVRTHDSAATIGATLAALHAQSVTVEVIIVDSGSTDGTLEIAASSADVVVHLTPGTFTFGGSLNAGADAARATVCFALSSHVVPPDERWVERALAHHEDPSVVATTGTDLAPDGHGPLIDVVRQDLAHARAHPRWGMSCTAASWRADVFARHRFDPACEASEDKEWALRALAEGGVVVVDPSLAVDSSHRRAAGWAAYLARVRREDRALLRLGLIEERTPVAALRTWWVGAAASPPQRRGFTSVTRAVDTAALLAAQHDVRREGGRAR